MNNVRKLTALVLCFALLAGFGACGKQKENPDLLTDEIASITDSSEEPTEDSTAAPSTEAPTISTLESSTGDTSETQDLTVPPAPPATTALRTIPAPTAAPHATAAPAPATAAPVATAAPATAAPATTAAQTTAAPAPAASESPILPGTPVEVPLTPGETTVPVLPVATDAPSGDSGVPPMPNLSQNTLDENGAKLTINGTDLYIGGNVDTFVSVNAPLRQTPDPNTRFVNGQAIQCIEYAYADYVVLCNAADHTVIGIDLSGQTNTPITTLKGIHVGSTLDEVVAAYGADYNNSGLQFTFNDGIVTMISIGS